MRIGDVILKGDVCIEDDLMEFTIEWEGNEIELLRVQGFRKYFTLTYWQSWWLLRRSGNFTTGIQAVIVDRDLKWGKHKRNEY